MASVYWVRSLVPIEKKLASCASTSAIQTALGVSIMSPISSPGSCGTPSRASSSRTFWHIAWALRNSSSFEIIGNMTRTRPWALAR
jgi:hypothetical protein